MVVNENYARAKDDVDRFLALESHPYTQNHYLFENISKKRNHLLKTRMLRQIKTRLSSELVKSWMPQHAFANLAAANAKTTQVGFSVSLVPVRLSKRNYILGGLIDDMFRLTLKREFAHVFSPITRLNLYPSVIIYSE